MSGSEENLTSNADPISSTVETASIQSGSGESRLSRAAFMNVLRGLLGAGGNTVEGGESLSRRFTSSLFGQGGNTDASGNFFDQLGLLLEEDEEGWSDDEACELGIQDWLTAFGFNSGFNSDAMSSSKPGLSKSVTRSLQKEVYVTSEPGKNIDVHQTCEQDMCSVCLEQFVIGQDLICLPCKHRFHPDCLTPWLESHTQCPYCRTVVNLESTDEPEQSNGWSLSMLEDLIAWMEAVDSELTELNIS